MPVKPPFEALKSKKGNSMSTQSKVSSWIEKNDAVDTNGSDDSSDAESSSAAGSTRPHGANGVAQDDDVELLDEEEEEPDEVDEEEQQEEVDWEKVLGRLRLELGDPSKKRRKAFISRYLDGSSDRPPIAQTPAVISSILSLLPLTYDFHHLDDLVSVLIRLVKKDEVADPDSLSLGDKLVKWVSMETDKAVVGGRTVVPAGLLPYLILTLGLVTSISASRPGYTESKPFEELVSRWALLLDAIAAKSSNKQETHASQRFEQKVKSRSMIAIRSLGSHSKRIQKILLEKLPSDGWKNAVLLGCWAAHILGTSPKGKERESVNIPFSASDRDAVISYYAAQILGSKTAVPPHASRSLSFFLSKAMTLDIFTTTLLPVADRMLLRSPENALPLVADLLQTTQIDISCMLPSKLVPPILSASKSSNAETRAKSVSAMQAVVGRCSDTAVLAKIVTDILNLPKTGKSASPEHRVALFSMTASIPRSDAVSPTVIDTLAPLISKEGNEPALSALGSALVPHLAHVLASTAPLAANTGATLAKELNSSKASARSVVSHSVGAAFWAIHISGTPISAEGEKLVASLSGALATALQTTASVQPSATATFSEGFVAVALALGPLAELKSASNLTGSPALDELLIVSPKPSFLLNDRVYRRLSSSIDELWFSRAITALTRSKAGKLKQESVRLAIGAALLHVALDSAHGNVRRDALHSVTSLIGSTSNVGGLMLRDSLQAWLTALDTKQRALALRLPSEDDKDVIESHSRSLGQLFDAILAPQPNLSQGDKEELAISFLVITHHPAINEDAQVSWISLVQRIGLNAADVALNHKDRILSVVQAPLKSPPADEQLAQAAYRAITTLCFLQPGIYVDAILERIRTDLDAASLDFIGDEEHGIWLTPEDQTYVDPLNTGKKDGFEVKNRKGYADDKWDQEVRSSLAKKKAAAGGLSKQDKALVDAQLQKEAEIRQRIRVTQARLKRGTELVNSLVLSVAEQVSRYVGEMASLLLRSVFSRGSFLVDKRVFDVFISFANLLTDRLGQNRRIVLSAILRAQDAAHIPDDYVQEDLKDLAIRLLYHINTVSSQLPLDSTTFSVVAILLSQLIEKGGIGTESIQSDEAQEQLTVAVNIIEASCGEFADDRYPRLQIIQDLVKVIGSHPRLARDGASALVEVGAAIKDVASRTELDELLKATVSSDANVRSAALQALQPVDLTELDYSPEIWIAAHDPDEQNANLAEHLWEDNGLDTPENFLDSLLLYLGHTSPSVRRGTAFAIAAACEAHTGQVEPTLDALQAVYIDKAKVLQPEYDRFGMIIPETVNRPDPFETRAAVGAALEQLVPLTPKSRVESLFDFFITSEALGDRASPVRAAVLSAAIALIDAHGKAQLGGLMKTFETYLGQPQGSSDTSDYLKEAVVILFGRLAGHLESQDARIPQVVDRLVDALNTPSESVQVAVADCLPALVQDMGDEAEYLVDRLFSTLTTGAKYASRRGAAYGLAGVVKGRGLRALKDYDLLDKLREAAEDKSAFQSRQGALFAFETLSVTMGRAFEPYIISIIPLLLSLFGDTNADVREATQDAAKVIMSRVSGHAVKLMLPTLLGGLDEKQWRTKKGSIELLGAMAFCAPRQLSISLPTIIPQLTGVINDSHAQVKSAANTSLKRFGEVLNNPEVKSIQNALMKALADPAAKNNSALSALLKTTFDHYLDAPSLALVMPIIDRGLRNRSSDQKRKAVQIVGNMASLTESRDLVPYLTQLMPLVHDVLVDPVPEARATAAKSLGTLVERLGETNFPSLVSQLLQTLRSDTSGVDRQGAAQGLSEVLSGLGMERLEGLLPEVIQQTSSPRPYVREGFISLLVYLPATFGHRFAPHLGRVVPPILNGLADESEYVREASMRAGKMIIANYSNKAIDLLLPELEKGMLDPVWRIRQSSISLTGELLYRVTGISGKVELEEEDVPAQSADQARKALLEALGQERRDRVLATLYIVRQDAVGIVRQASIHIWKALVQNTPRTTREILPVLMQLLTQLLGSPQEEQQETASRTLGELCRKNGERIIGEIVPILRKAISSPDEKTKEGACLAFADVMAASSKEVIHNHEDTIISAVRSALVDSSATVRTAAARTFDTMQHYMGAKAIDQTIPTLLEAMRNPGEGSETALQALQEVMSVRANSVFPVLIPTLIAQPITAFNARALGALVKVAGRALNRHLDTVLGALVKSAETEKDEARRTEVASAIEAILAAVTDAEGVHLLEMLLIGWAKDPSPKRRATACRVFGTMCQVNSSDTAEYRVDWIRILISLFNDSNEDTVTAAWEAMEHFVKTIDKDELEDLVVPLRRSIEACGQPGHHVPGFCRPKGAQSIVPILLAGVLSGTQEQREQAAFGIGDLVQRTTEAAIKPYIIQLTGPLIRVISGQTIAPQIKGAILSTLTVLLQEVPQLVRPFHPQLTRTFVKSASDPAALSVRARAATGLGELMKHQPRVDPLITELIGGIRAAEKDIAPSVALALAAVCTSAGKNIGAPAKAAIIDLVEDAFAEPRTETYNTAMGKIVAGLAVHDAQTIRPIVDTFLGAPTPPIAISSVTILAVMEQVPEAFLDLQAGEEVASKVVASVASDSSAVARPAREAREIMKTNGRWKGESDIQAILK